MAMEKDKTSTPSPKFNNIGQSKTVLVSFESGHYKTVTGYWCGSPQWTHFRKLDGKMIHLNKDKIEYCEEV